MDRPILKVASKFQRQEPGRERSDSDKERAEQRKLTIKERQQRIDEAQAAVAQVKIDNYSERFSQETKKDAVILAEVGMDTLHEENAKLEDLKAQKQEKERKKYVQHKQQLSTLQEDSKAEQLHRGEIMKKQIFRTELESIEHMKEKQQVLRFAFRNAGVTLMQYLGESRGEVQRKYKDLVVGDKQERHNLTGDSHTVAADGTITEEEQVVELRVELVRCVKDKLPKGRYAILCSVLDHIGGSVIDYQADRSKRWRRITAPKIHSGEYHLNNLRFEKSILMVAPKRSEVRPSMVYLFELFLLKSKEFSHDQVLGWGVFPLISADFELNKGDFKVWFNT